MNRTNPWGFVTGEGHRWWTDPNKCPHSNENVCEGCDFDGYYAANYATCPWGNKADDDLERPYELVLSDDGEPGDLG